MTTDAAQRYERYVVNSVIRQGLTIVRARGCTLWDSDGREYLDFFVGRGAANLGYGHPAVVEALVRQAETLLFASNDFFTDPQGALAEALVEAAFDGRVFFSNCGTEANEVALKIARRHAWLAGRPGRTIVAVEGGFHGRTLGALSATGEPRYQEGFAPLVPEIVHVPRDDVGALEAAVGDHVVAVLAEVVQGEAGVRPARPEWLRRARELCTRHGAALIFDEVQTGMGRCGTLFAHQRLGVVPDVMTLGKSLGGGVPVAATLASRPLAEALTIGTQGSTFGGTPLMTAAALAALGAVRGEEVRANAAAREPQLRELLAALAGEHPDTVAEVRGLGLMWAVELREPLAAEVVARCRDRGVLVTYSGDRILRLLPALVVTEEEVERALGVLAEAIAAVGAPRVPAGARR